MILLDSIGDDYPTFPQFVTMLREYERRPAATLAIDPQPADAAFLAYRAARNRADINRKTYPMQGRSVVVAPTSVTFFDRWLPRTSEGRWVICYQGQLADPYVYATKDIAEARCRYLGGGGRYVVEDRT